MRATDRRANCGVAQIVEEFKTLLQEIVDVPVPHVGVLAAGVQRTPNDVATLI